MRPRAIFGALFLAGVLAAGVLLRLEHIERSLWYDELFTLVHFARPSISHALGHQKAANNHPLYSALAHLALRWLPGGIEFRLRFPAFLLGIVILPVLWLVAAELARAPPGPSIGRTTGASSGLDELGGDIGLIAVLFAATAPALVVYSQEARGYSGAALSLLFVFRGVTQPGPTTSRDLAILAVATLTALWFHLATGLSVLAFGLALIVAAKTSAIDRREAKRRGAALGGGVIAAVLVYLPILKRVVSFARRHIGTDPDRQISLGELWSGLISWDAPVVAGLIVIAFALVGFVRLASRSRPAALAGGGAVVLSLAFWSLPKTLFFPRFLVPLQPIIILFAALGFGVLRRRIGRGVLLLPIIVALLWTYANLTRLPEDQDLRGALQLAQRWTPGGGRGTVVAGGLGAELLGPYCERAIPVVSNAAELEAALSHGAQVVIEPFARSSPGPIQDRLASWRVVTLAGRRHQTRLYRRPNDGQ